MRRKDREVSDLKDIVSILDSCKTCHAAMRDGGGSMKNNSEKENRAL